MSSKCSGMVPKPCGEAAAMSARLGKQAVGAAEKHRSIGCLVAEDRQPIALDPVGQMPPAAPLLDLTGFLEPFQLGGMVEKCGRRRVVESVEIGHLLGSSEPRLQ